MGLAASQGRLLTLTSRMSDLERRSQSISNQKMRLTTLSGDASQKYQNALNKEKITFNNGENIVEATAENLTQYTPNSSQQMFLKTADGKTFVNSKTADAYNNSGKNLTTFLANLGLTSVQPALLAQSMQATLGSSTSDLQNSLKGSFAGTAIGLADNLTTDKADPDALSKILNLIGTDESKSLAGLASIVATDGLSHDNVLAEKIFGEDVNLNDWVSDDITLHSEGIKITYNGEETTAKPKVFGPASEIANGKFDKVSDYDMGVMATQQSIANYFGVDILSSYEVPNEDGKFDTKKNTFKPVEDEKNPSLLTRIANALGIKKDTEDYENLKAAITEVANHYANQVPVNFTIDTNSLNVTEKPLNAEDYAKEMGTKLNSKDDKDIIVVLGEGEDEKTLNLKKHDYINKAGKSETIYYDNKTKNMYEIGELARTDKKELESNAGKDGAISIVKTEDVPIYFAKEITEEVITNIAEAIDFTTNYVNISDNNERLVVAEDDNINLYNSTANGGKLNQEKDHWHISLSQAIKGILSIYETDSLGGSASAYNGDTNSYTRLTDDEVIATLQKGVNDMFANSALTASTNINADVGNYVDSLKSYSKFLSGNPEVAEIFENATGSLTALDGNYENNLDTVFAALAQIGEIASQQGAFSAVNSGLTYDASKVNYYTNVFNEIQNGGLAVLGDEMKTADWLNTNLSSGNVYLSRKTDSQDVDAKAERFNYKADLSSISVEADETAIAKAEAEYETALSEINAKDKVYDIEKSQIDTEYSSTQTMYDAEKKRIDENIERAFKLFA